MPAAQNVSSASDFEYDLNGKGNRQYHSTVYYVDAHTGVIGWRKK
jgi:hypothetical protein